MTSDDYPSWEPPLAGTEVEHLLGALERLRTTFRWKADALDAAGLNKRLASSDLSLGALLKHLARAEDEMFTVKLFGRPRSEPWASMEWDESQHWDFDSAADDAPEELYALWDSTITRSRARVAEALDKGGLDFESQLGWGGQKASLRRLLFDLIEEYGRHTGHADLLRENVDGRVGEDPPRGWRPS